MHAFDWHRTLKHIMRWMVEEENGNDDFKDISTITWWIRLNAILIKQELCSSLLCQSVDAFDWNLWILKVVVTVRNLSHFRWAYTLLNNLIFISTLIHKSCCYFVSFCLFVFHLAFFLRFRNSDVGILKSIFFQIRLILFKFAENISR